MHHLECHSKGVGCSCKVAGTKMPLIFITTISVVSQLTLFVCILNVIHNDIVEDFLFLNIACTACLFISMTTFL